jgi:hypothetical protein
MDISWERAYGKRFVVVTDKSRAIGALLRAAPLKFNLKIIP